MVDVGGEETCLICLDPIAPDKPLWLLNCGCKNGWFHPSCENEWLDSLPRGHQARILCPMCRQPVEMKTNYCFAWTAGPEQARLWVAGVGLVAEFLYAAVGTYLGGHNLLYLPTSSALILLLPFVSPRLIWQFDGYVFHLLVHLGGEASVAFLCFAQHPPFTQVIDLQLVVAAFHIFLVYLVHLIEHQNQWHRTKNLADVFDSYAISREIYHIKVLAIQPVAGPAEGDERRGLGDLEPPVARGSRGGRSGRRRGGGGRRGRN